MSKKSQKIKFKRAPSAPKRFKSAYMFYSAQEHRSIRENSSDKKVRSIDCKGVSRSYFFVFFSPNENCFSASIIWYRQDDFTVMEDTSPERESQVAAQGTTRPRTLRKRKGRIQRPLENTGCKRSNCTEEAYVGLFGVWKRTKTSNCRGKPNNERHWD